MPQRHDAPLCFLLCIRSACGGIPRGRKGKKGNGRRVMREAPLCFSLRVRRTCGENPREEREKRVEEGGGDEGSFVVLLAVLQDRLRRARLGDERSEGKGEWSGARCCSGRLGLAVQMAFLL
eukprot:200859-Chlamydomonas_euryale.AAC.1